MPSKANTNTQTDHETEPGNREMARREQDTISHFSHPGHELVKRHYVGPFLCDMCWEGLSGPAYGCLAGCDFAIHDSCAGHPQTFSSLAHHAHPLVLVQTRRDVAVHQCDVCAGRCAPGSFLYRCPPCEFDMHPTCARLPQVVRSARHPVHDLTLVVVVADGRCAACGDAGPPASSYYRCAECNVDFHVSCAATTDDGGDNSAHEARDVDGITLVQKAAAAQRKLQVAVLGARLQMQGFQSASDLIGPSYSSFTSMRDYI